MNDSNSPPELPGKDETLRFTLGVLIGFFPSVIAIWFLQRGSPWNPPNYFFWSVCALSLVCCFVSASILFAQKTGWAIFYGVSLLLVNGCIAFYAGCSAVFWT